MLETEKMGNPASRESFASVAGRDALQRAGSPRLQIFKADGIGRGRNICFPIRGQPFCASRRRYFTTSSTAHPTLSSPSLENGRWMANNAAKSEWLAARDAVFRLADTRRDVLCVPRAFSAGIDEMKEQSVVRRCE